MFTSVDFMLLTSMKEEKPLWKVIQEDADVPTAA